MAYTAKKTEEKQPIIAEISSAIENADAVVLVHYSGITVEADTQLRKELREAGVTYKVYKNTMLRFAFKDTPCEALSSLLDGPNAVAISKNDATVASRIISKYNKTAPTMKMLGGVIEGKFLDENDVTALANVPSRDELIGKLLGSIQSPISNLARVLNQIAEAQSAPAAAETPAE